MASILDRSLPLHDDTLRPADMVYNTSNIGIKVDTKIANNASTENHENIKQNDNGDEEVEQVDPRAQYLSMELIHADMDHTDAKVIMSIALLSYNKFVFIPTQSTWRKDNDGTLRELERDVERTSLNLIAEDIKRQTEEHFGGIWHVVYGREYGCYFTYQTRNSLRFKIDGAVVTVWRHGGEPCLL